MRRQPLDGPPVTLRMRRVEVAAIDRQAELEDLERSDILRRVFKAGMKTLGIQVVEEEEDEGDARPAPPRRVASSHR